MKCYFIQYWSSLRLRVHKSSQHDVNTASVARNAIVIIRWRALDGARVDASQDCVVEGRDQSYQAIFILTDLSGAVSLLGDG